MRDEGSKQKNKEGMGDGPPSNIKRKQGSIPQKQSGKKAAEVDMESQRDPRRAEESADPFTSMMKMASRNSKYSPGFVDKGDPTNATPDEHKNMPKTRRQS